VVRRAVATDGFPSGIHSRDPCGLLDIRSLPGRNAADGNYAVAHAVRGSAIRFYDVVLLMVADKVPSRHPRTLLGWAGMTPTWPGHHPASGWVAPATSPFTWRTLPARVASTREHMANVRNHHHACHTPRSAAFDITSAGTQTPDVWSVSYSTTARRDRLLGGALLLAASEWRPYKKKTKPPLRYPRTVGSSLTGHAPAQAGHDHVPVQRVRAANAAFGNGGAYPRYVEYVSEVHDCFTSPESR